jgi:putative DNA primase/helicase
VGTLGPGIDVKHKGYVMVEPSVHPSGGIYRWVRSLLEHEPANLPPAWIARIVKPAARRSTDSLPPTSPGNATPYGQAAVDDELKRVRLAPKGERNNSLNVAAHSLAQLHAGGQVGDVREELVATAMIAGLREGEARKTVDSGWRAGLRKPRAPARPLENHKNDTVSRSGKESGEVPKQPSATADRSLPPPDGPQPAREYSLSETGAAELMAARLAGDWHYVPERDKWIRWNGKHWEFDPGAVQLAGLSKLVAREFLAEARWALENNDPRAENLTRFATAAQRRNTRKNTIDLLKSEPGIPIRFSEFGKDPFLLNCQNGTLDLRLGVLREHRREDKITRILPWVFDADAACPRWDRFLIEVLPDAETIAFAQRLVGYCLTGDISEHVVIFLFGRGANGKSVFLNTLLALLGEYATQAPTSMLIASSGERHPTELVTLYARNLVVCAEVPGSKAWNEELIKSISGGDPISARGMREDFWNFNPTHKLLISGNHKPVVRGQDEGIWRRWRILPFERTIAEADRDPDLTKKLVADMPGILAWAVRGCTAWQRDRLRPSSKVLVATSDYRSESDRLAPFIDECCEFRPQAIISRAALYRSYQEWSEAQGERHALSGKDFAEYLRGRGVTNCYTRSDGKKCRGWKGIELATAGNTKRSDFSLSSSDQPSREVSPENKREVLSGVAGTPDQEEGTV